MYGIDEEKNMVESRVQAMIFYFLTTVGSRKEDRKKNVLAYF